MTRFMRCAALALAVGLLAATQAAAQDRLPVVATFSILGDMVRAVGGDDVSVATLVGPNGDAHGFEPKPADARTVGGAKLVVANGLGFDSWIHRLAKAAGYGGRLAIASKGVTVRKAEHEPGGHAHENATDPHAWQDLDNGRRYVANIADALAAADPSHAAAYRARAEAYDRELAALDAEIRAELNAIPRPKRRIITSHDAFGYLGRSYGIDFLSPLGLGTDSQPSAKDMAALIRQMKRENVRVLFVETMTDSRLIQQLAREGGGIVGGQVYSDALSERDGPAPTYVEMFRHNVRAFTAALKQAGS